MILYVAANERNAAVLLQIILVMVILFPRISTEIWRSLTTKWLSTMEQRIRAKRNRNRAGIKRYSEIDMRKFR